MNGLSGIKFWAHCKCFWKGKISVPLLKISGNRMHLSKPHSNNGGHFFLTVLQGRGSLRPQAQWLLCSQYSVNITLCSVYSSRIPGSKRKTFSQPYKWEETELFVYTPVLRGVCISPGLESLAFHKTLSKNSKPNLHSVELQMKPLLSGAKSLSKAY